MGIEEGTSAKEGRGDGDWRLQNTELHNLYSTPNIMRVIILTTLK